MLCQMIRFGRCVSREMVDGVKRRSSDRNPGPRKCVKHPRTPMKGVVTSLNHFASASKQWILDYNDLWAEAKGQRQQGGKSIQKDWKGDCLPREPSLASPRSVPSQQTSVIYQHQSQPRTKAFKLSSKDSRQIKIENKQT